MSRYTGYTSVLSVLVMAAISAAGQDWSIEMAPARKRLVNRNELVLYCRTDREIDGCTEFLGETLHCECRRVGDDWTMTAHAQLVPYMYLMRPRIEEHEQKHVDDLRHQLGIYLADLATRHYEDRGSCGDVADFEMTVFSIRMELFRRRSNARLH